MIVRARTEINENLILQILRGNDNNHLSSNALSFFFNSGSASLRFFLRIIGKKKRIGVQVYTCSTVLDAINEEGCIPIFLDINPNYYTTTIDCVRNRIQEMDILLLSHLFGIPNPDYLEIKELCHENGVILVDDLCQTFHAQVNGYNLEDLSDNYFYSFFYDKPISMLSGGMLKINECYEKKALSLYEKLPLESEEEGRKELKVLYFMHQLLSPSIYRSEFRKGIIWKKILSVWPLYWNVSIVYPLLSSKICKSMNRLFIHKTKNQECYRMSNVRTHYVLSMMNSYSDNNKNLIDFLNSNKIIFPDYLCNRSIKCSLAKRAILKVNFESSQAEIALYNWPRLICKDSQTHLYPNAKSVIDTHINIPVWSSDILQINNVK